MIAAKVAEFPARVVPPGTKAQSNCQLSISGTSLTAFTPVCRASGKAEVALLVAAPSQFASSPLVSLY